MLISTFSRLLSDKYPHASAYVPDTTVTLRHMSKTRKTSVCVVYSDGGKVYTYNGTIHNTAERIGLIPTPDIQSDAERIARDLLAGTQSRGYAASIDTVRYLLGDKVSWVSSIHDGVDDYDNDMSVYAVTDNPSGW